MNRKMLSTNSSRSCFSTSRKYSATVSAESATRWRAPGGSFIWPNTSAVFESTDRAVEQLGLVELVEQVVALAGALADAGEHRVAAVLLRDVVDQLLDEHGLADAGAAEQADLAAAAIRREQVDDLDAGLEHLDLDALVGERRRRAVDRRPLGRLDRTGLVDRLADDVHDAAEHFGADRHRDRRAGVLDRLAADEAVGGVHRDAADRVLAEVLGDLDGQVVLALVDRRVGEQERGVDLRQLGRVERDVDDRSDDLDHAAHACWGNSRW